MQGEAILQSSEQIAKKIWKAPFQYIATLSTRRMFEDKGGLPPQVLTCSCAPAAMNCASTAMGVVPQGALTQGALTQGVSGTGCSDTGCSNTGCDWHSVL